MSEEHVAKEVVQQKQLEKSAAVVKPDVSSKNVVEVVCPACGAKVQAVTYGKAKIDGYCAAAGQYVSIDIGGEK